MGVVGMLVFFFSSRRRHTRFDCDWSSDVCSSDLVSRGSWPPQALMISGARAQTMATRGIGRVYTRPSRLRRDGTRGVGYKEVRPDFDLRGGPMRDRKSTRLNSSHSQISYAVFCLKKKKNKK